MSTLCYNDITIGAEPEVIQMFVDCEFSFKKLRPTPTISTEENYNEYCYHWCSENWGTTTERSDYNINYRGKNGLNITFITEWVPPLELLRYLVEKYKIWIKCQWREEDGLSGILIGQHTGEFSDIREFVWEDWSLEENKIRMTL